MVQGKIFKSQIQERDLDFLRRPTFTSLCDSTLDVAGFDANQRGCGVKDISKDGRSWVISRMAFEWLRMPQCFEEIFTETWIESVNRLMTTRDFIIRDKDQKQIGAATTLWAMIDLETRRPVDLRSQQDYICHVINKPSPIEGINKFPATRCDVEHLHRVVYSDLDFNNHTNTMKYIEWMCDMIPLEIIKERFIRRFDIHFIHEALYGETLTILCQNDDPTYFFEIKNQQNVSICKACITL